MIPTNLKQEEIKFKLKKCLLIWYVVNKMYVNKIIFEISLFSFIVDGWKRSTETDLLHLNNLYNNNSTKIILYFNWLDNLINLVMIVHAKHLPKLIQTL